MKTHLKQLEAESIYIIREAFQESENPVMLFSLGKDSCVMLHLAKKAFYPGKIPFPLMHVDTGWKFTEMYEFRDKLVDEEELKLIVHKNPRGAKENIGPISHGSEVHTEIMKTQALKAALDKHKFDLAFGGARRDEEKSRAKERIFSFRTSEHSWDPKNQRPELWNVFNCRKKAGESLRVFPISNWTELDVWQYIYQEKIQLVPLYFSKKRKVIERDGVLIYLNDDRLEVKNDEEIQEIEVRFRTLGCYPLTGAIKSKANTLDKVILEILNSNYSERQGRLIDDDSNSSMEQKKQEGYF